jgi:multidrug resistance protein MdtO
MVLPANERSGSTLAGLAALLAPAPGRLEFAVRLALICALTTLLVEIYQTPEPALTVYLVFFVIKPDRATSVVASVVMLLLITLIIGAVLVITMQVIDQPFWRVVAMTIISFGLLFLASASKLKPIAGTVALITAFALDLLGTAHTGETATRALLYAWLFVGIPAGACIVVNLVLGPPPRRLAEKALAHRLHLCAMMLRTPALDARRTFEEYLHKGLGEIPAWLKMAGAEKTSPAQDIAALRQAAQSTAVIQLMVEVIVRAPERLLPETLCERIAQTFEDMAAILRKGGYPTDVALDDVAGETTSLPLAAAVIAELQAALTHFAKPPPPEPSPKPVEKAAGGFFLPDAFTNPAHVRHAIKTTAAAMLCYFVYSLLDWPGIHTCLITCYIVSLGTTAETVEKLTLRILGCLVGAGAGIAAIVFLMPNVTSIGALLALVFLAALVSGWIAAGSPRISYVGFQIAFAFFLCVVQGSAPTFDMTIARDRVIGILFGNLVVALVFTLIWPSSVARRIDPALAALLRRLGAMVSAPSRSARWALATEAQTALCAIEQDIDLTRYEPPSLRPTTGWLKRRRDATQALASLQWLLLIDAEQDPPVSSFIMHRLHRLAEAFAAPRESEGTLFGKKEGSITQPVPEEAPAPPGRMDAFIEAPLGILEQAIALRNVIDEEGRIDDAYA